MRSHTTSILYLLSLNEHTIQMCPSKRVVSCASLSINNISFAESQQTNPHLPFSNCSNSQRSEWESEDSRASLRRALSAMASTATAATCALASPSLGQEGCRAAAAPRCISLPPPHTAPNVASTNHSQARQSWKTAAHCRKIARNAIAMATGDAPAEVATELPDIVKPIQDAWDRLEDKYAVTSLGVAVVIALWGSTGMISAIDRLPLVPGILELVGIGYTGWFAYRNLVFKPDREALIAKIKSIYSEIIGG